MFDRPKEIRGACFIFNEVINYNLHISNNLVGIGGLFFYYREITYKFELNLKL